MIPQPGALTATALILVKTGSKYESAQESGLSHFLEHMMFKGTARYPSAKKLAELFDGLGAISNAFTDRELTGYYAKGNPAHLDTFIDTLADIYLNTQFAEDEVARERGVIIEEYNMYEDMPQYKASEQLYVSLYGDQPAGRPVLGTKDTIRSFTAKDFVAYKQKHYSASNTIIVVAGDFKAAQVKKNVAKVFAPLATRTSSKKQKVVDTQHTRTLSVFTKKTDQTHVVIGFRALPIGHKDALALSLLSTILGGGMSSRLFIKLREERGAAYYVNSSYEAFTDHGIFSIHTGIDKKRIGEIMEVIVDELASIKKDGIPAAELAKAQQYSIGMMRLGLESSDDIAGFCGTQLLLKGAIRTPQERTEQIMQITTADICRVARKIFVSNHANISVVGPFKTADIDTGMFDRL